MKKNLVLLFVILSALYIIIFAGCGKNTDKSDNSQSSTQTKKKDSVVIVTIGVDSLNALEVLKTDHDVIEVSSTMGTFVKGIDGVKNDMNTFWFFEVNRKMASKAADKIMTTPSDTIRWYFRQPRAEPVTEDNESR